MSTDVKSSSTPSQDLPLDDSAESADQQVVTEEGQTEEEEQLQKTKDEKKAEEDQSEEKKQFRKERESGFKETRAKELATKLPKQFGYRINTSREVAKQDQQQSPPEQKSQTQQRQSPQQKSSQQQSRQAQTSQQPPRQAYKAVIQDRAFQGSMRQTSLYQKMQQRFVNHAQTQQAHLNRESAHHVLKRGEVAQFFRLRNQAQDRQSLRQVLRHEIEKARQRQTQRRIQNLKGRAEQDKSQSKEKLSKAAFRFDASKQNLAQKIQTQGSESAFEQILQKVLAGGKAVPGLPEGVHARFAAKTDAQWQQFFMNLLPLKSTEVRSQEKMTKLLSALFRGIFNKGSRQMLVVDLKMAEGQEKFSQIPLDQRLAKIFKGLQPGDVISKEALQSLGETVTFLKLVHVLDQHQLTKQQREELLKQFQKQMSSQNKTAMEDALIRNRRESRKTKEPFAWAGDQFDNKEERPGPPKIFLFVLFAGGLTLVALLVFLLFQYLN